MNRFKFMIILAATLLSLNISFSSCESDPPDAPTDPTPIDSTGLPDTVGHYIELIGVSAFGLSSNNRGFVFKMRADGSDIVILDTFTNQTGWNFSPWSGLCKSPNGKFYGVTISGGAANAGTVYSFDPATNQIKKILDFTSIFTGACPGFALGVDGMLYSFYLDNTSGQMSMLRLNPNNDTYSYVWQGSSNVAGLNSNRMILGHDNNLYGVTNVSSPSTSNGYGCIFKYSPSTNTVVKLYDRIGANGNNTFGPLCEATNGLFYGVANNGGINDWGTIFKFNPNGSEYGTAFAFDSIHGKEPSNTNVLEGTGNKLYGFTRHGGALDEGVIYDYQPGSGTQQVKYSYDNVGESAPTDCFMKFSNGYFYGIANGTLFRFNPANSAYRTVKSLSSTTFMGPFMVAEK